jgi:thioredoxin-like negative regulator of GroEL
MNSANKPVVFIFIVLLAMAAVVVISRKRAAGDDRIPWRASLSAAQSESRQTGKPVFAYFTADWCGPCQSLKRTTWPDSNVQSALSQFVPVKIDIDEHRDVAARYAVQFIPMFAILDNDGNIRARIEGARGPDELIAWMKSR